MNIAKEISFFFFILLTEAFASVGRVFSMLAKFLLAYFGGGILVIGWLESLIQFGDVGQFTALLGGLFVPLVLFSSLLSKEEKEGEWYVVLILVLFATSMANILLWDHLEIISWFGGGTFSKKEAANLLFAPIFELLS